jgi:hypothetical protein
MPLYTLLHNFASVLVQIANKIGLRKKIQSVHTVPEVRRAPYPIDTWRF